MEYAAPGTESYNDGGNGWYGEGGDSAPVEQQGFSIPTTGQSNGGGPIRRGGSGGSRYNPIGSRSKPGGGDSGPVSASTAEKNELGFIIFAYNIGYQTDENQLQNLFQAYGSVSKVNVIQDFATGQGKGFGFVTMPNAEEAETAIVGLNGTDFEGNTLQIRFKTPKGQSQSSSPGGMRGSRGGGFRGGARGGGFRGGSRGAPRGGGFRGARGATGMRGGGRGRGRGGTYSSAPSAYDTAGYGGGYGSYDAYGGGGYSDPNAAPAYGGYDYADPYAGYSTAGSGYASYGAASTPQW